MHSRLIRHAVSLQRRAVARLPCGTCGRRRRIPNVLHSCHVYECTLFVVHHRGESAVPRCNQLHVCNRRLSTLCFCGVPLIRITADTRDPARFNPKNAHLTFVTLCCLVPRACGRTKALQNVQGTTPTTNLRCVPHHMPCCLSYARQLFLFCF